MAGKHDLQLGLLRGWRAAALGLAPAALWLAACGADSEGSARFEGGFAGPVETGRLELTIALAPSDLESDDAEPGLEPGENVAAIGVLYPSDGAPISLQGSYIPQAETVYLAGGTYVLGGYLDDDASTEGGFEGQYFGPQGRGLVSLHRGTGGEVVVLCGGFDGTFSGMWVVVRSVDALSAMAVPGESDRRAFHFAGRREDAGLVFEEEEFEGPVLADAVGTLAADGQVASGTWTLGEAAGTWSVSAAGCVGQS